MTLDLFRRPDEAVFSSDGRYRYRLTREIGTSISRSVAFIMLNPSTATATENDPTIRRCIGYARSWGMGKLIVGNLFALVSTDPRALYLHPSPIGPENDRHLTELGTLADLIVVAYGTHGSHQGRGRAVIEMFRHALIPVHCLALTKDGHPAHPLYQRADLMPQPFTSMQLPEMP